VALSAPGRRLCRRLDPVWTQIRQANGELLAAAGVDLLADLTRLEAALAVDSMADRVRRRLGLAPADPVHIEDYRPTFKRHFRQLNELWLTEHFAVEDGDRHLLADPAGRIVRRGGAVFFAVAGDDVVGTCALIRHRDQTWELAKMAVAADWRRRGLGRRLTLAAIERTRAGGGVQLWLRTSPHLQAACHLYRSLGFRRVRRHPFPAAAYQRETIVMKLDLTPNEEISR
jgi:ribosomal protein S18 acetylase RimI-like enzyme